MTSAKVDFLAKFSKFFRGPRSSPSTEVAFMANLNRVKEGSLIKEDVYKFL
jgi:hypothetical protein